MKSYIIFILICMLVACTKKQEEAIVQKNKPYLLILGNAQDAGYPQIACTKVCCTAAKNNPALKRMVSSLALIDPISNQSWIIDASPDLTEQTSLLAKHLKQNKQLPDAIFLTHGHIGHYTGLMYLGKESLNSQQLPVYAMPRMQEYLSQNGPWNQLVKLKNIKIQSLKQDSIINLNKRLNITPLLVPHRDEFSETVGYLIDNQGKKALFIPDIDKWGKWQKSIIDYIKKVDIALLDATFFKNGEIDRDMNEVPHPFVEESMILFKDLSSDDKAKVHFIHFNHTNPLLIEDSEAQRQVYQKGFKIAKQGMQIGF